MVEGPSCWRKADRLKILVGQRLISAQHKSLLECLDQAVTRVFAVGKELFIVFITHALRLHFGMSGGAEFCGVGSKYRALNGPIVLISRFIGGSLRVHGAQSSARSVDLHAVAAAEAKASRDILSPVFDRGSALALLKAGGERIVCDIIMDQHILPGVGNVIKVEGLFSAAVYPLVRAGTLSDPQLGALVEGLRSCAQNWYASLRGRGRFNKRCYGNRFCTKCRTRIVLVREGALQRITYFCPACQQAGNAPEIARNSNAVTRLVARTGSTGSQASSTGSTPPIVAKSVGRLVLMPTCRCGKLSSLKQTFKAGPNRERHFCACSKRSCNFFEWLDKQLPTCQHGHARLRRVLKMGPNNGRYFAACPGRRELGCKLFEWIDLREDSFAPITTHGEASTRRAPVVDFRKKTTHGPHEPVLQSGGDSGLCHDDKTPKQSLRSRILGKPRQRMSPLVLQSSGRNFTERVVGVQESASKEEQISSSPKRQRTQIELHVPASLFPGTLQDTGYSLCEGSLRVGDAATPGTNSDVKSVKRIPPSELLPKEKIYNTSGNTATVLRQCVDPTRTASNPIDGSSARAETVHIQKEAHAHTLTESDEELLAACILLECQQVQHSCLHPPDKRLMDDVVDLT